MDIAKNWVAGSPSSLSRQGPEYSCCPGRLDTPRPRYLLPPVLSDFPSTILLKFKHSLGSCKSLAFHIIKTTAGRRGHESFSNYNFLYVRQLHSWCVKR